MNLLSPGIKSSPVAVRVLPFAIFLGLTAAQGYFGEAGQYWFYFLKTVVGAWLIWEVRPHIPEMRWACSIPALVAGILVFVIWVGLGDFLKALGLDPARAVMKTTDGLAWNPTKTFAAAPAMAWFFIVVRIIGSSLVVPPLEEVFFRSFLYRYLEKTDFQTVPLGLFLPLPFLITSIGFGFEHHEWVAGILCGLIYQALVCWKKRLGDAITAHAITNFLLGIYVVWKGAWNFW
jgi:CAAX prenyl protease-like protein